MTNTTDMAAFYAIAARAKETGTSFVIPAETAMSMLKHIGVLRDNLEAERQRADKNGKMLERVAVQRDKAFADIEKAEAELAALKAKMDNPVVLPSRLPDEGYGGDAVRNWCRNESVTMCAKAIREAGFTVKGD